MMQGIQNFMKSRVGRYVIGALLTLIIASFAIFGIEDVIRRANPRWVAKVGDAEIGVLAFREAFNAELQGASRRVGRNVTAAEARAAGLDRQVLGRLVSDAALDARAGSLGLAASDETLARLITSDAAFKGPDGSFDRQGFEALLRNNGLTEAAFIANQRRELPRRQITEGIAGGLEVPPLLRAALHRLRTETRAVDVSLLPPGSVGEVAPPDEATLRAYFEARKATFALPERRRMSLLVLSPDTLADPASAPEPEVRALYDRVAATRYGRPERRAIDQLPLPDAGAVAKAEAALPAGGFEAAAKALGADPKELSLGTLTRGELFDPAVAAAAFEAAPGAVVGPVQGRFGPVLLRVAAVEAGTLRPYEEVKPDLAREVAVGTARRRIADLHDRIENARASARPLAEVAREQELVLRDLPALDAAGLDAETRPVPDLPDRAALLRAAFNAPPGADTEPLALSDGGYVWYDVRAVEPAREVTFEEARARVLTAWTADERARLLAASAAELVKRLGAGEDFAALAAGAGAEVRRAGGLTRARAPAGLPPGANEAIFAAPVGGAGTVLAADGVSRAVFVVRSASVPPEPSGKDPLEDQLRLAVVDDILVGYVSKLQDDLGTRIDERALRDAIGGASE